MDDQNEDGVQHIFLDAHAEKVLDVFNRAQSGDLEPFAKYIEEGGRIIPEMRLFLAAHLRGLLKFDKRKWRTLPMITRDHWRLRELRALMRDGFSEYKATEILAAEIGENVEALRAQIRKAKEEEAQGEIRIGPAYRP